jgi:hypothetical protein
LQVRLTVVGDTTPMASYPVTSDENGAFQVSGLTPGLYHVEVKGNHTLQRVAPNVTLNGGVTSLDLGLLPEGDAVADNSVDVLDFSRLAGGFSLCSGTAGYVAEADLNADACVNLADFSLLATNFGQVGEAVVAGAPSGTNQGLGGIADQYKRAGERFQVTVLVESDEAVTVDGAAVYLEYDPAELQVVAVAPTGPLSTVLAQQVDNEAGVLGYAAGVLGAGAPAPFPVAVITFESVRAEQAGELVLSVAASRRSDVAYQGRSMLQSASFDGGTTLSLRAARPQFTVYLSRITR